MSKRSLATLPTGLWDVPVEDIELVLAALAEISEEPDLVSIARNASRAARSMGRYHAVAIVLPTNAASAAVYGSISGHGGWETRLAVRRQPDFPAGTFSDRQLQVLIGHIQQIGGPACLTPRGWQPGSAHLRAVTGGCEPVPMARADASFYVPISDGTEITGLLCAGPGGGQMADPRRERLLVLFARALASMMRICRKASIGLKRRVPSPLGRAHHDDDLGIVPLSPRESQVLGLLARGLTTRKIAQTLSLRPNTVRSYVQVLLGKLQATNRLMALANARELGLIQDPLEG